SVCAPFAISCVLARDRRLTSVRLACQWVLSLFSGPISAKNTPMMRESIESPHPLCYNSGRIMNNFVAQTFRCIPRLALFICGMGTFGIEAAADESGSFFRSNDVIALVGGAN